MSHDMPKADPLTAPPELPNSMEPGQTMTPGEQVAEHLRKIKERLITKYKNADPSYIHLPPPWPKSYGFESTYEVEHISSHAAEGNITYLSWKTRDNRYLTSNTRSDIKDKIYTFRVTMPHQKPPQDSQLEVYSSYDMSELINHTVEFELCDYDKDKKNYSTGEGGKNERNFYGSVASTLVRPMRPLMRDSRYNSFQACKILTLSSSTADGIATGMKARVVVYNDASRPCDFSLNALYSPQGILEEITYSSYDERTHKAVPTSIWHRDRAPRKGTTLKAEDSYGVASVYQTSMYPDAMVMYCEEKLYGMKHGVPVPFTLSSGEAIISYLRERYAAACRME